MLETNKSMWMLQDIPVPRTNQKEKSIDIGFSNLFRKTDICLKQALKLSRIKMVRHIIISATRYFNIFSAKDTYRLLFNTFI